MTPSTSIFPLGIKLIGTWHSTPSQAVLLAQVAGDGAFAARECIDSHMQAEAFSGIVVGGMSLARISSWYMVSTYSEGGRRIVV